MKKTLFISTLLLLSFSLFLITSCKNNDEPLTFRVGETMGDHFIYHGTPQYCESTGGQNFTDCYYNLDGDEYADLTIRIGGYWLSGDFIRTCYAHISSKVSVAVNTLPEGSPVVCKTLAEGEDLLTGQIWFESTNGINISWTHNYAPVYLAFRFGDSAHHTYAWIQIERSQDCNWEIAEGAYMP